VRRPRISAARRFQASANALVFCVKHRTRTALSRKQYRPLALVDRIAWAREIGRRNLGLIWAGISALGGIPGRDKLLNQLGGLITMLAPHLVYDVGAGLRLGEVSRPAGLFAVNQEADQLALELARLDGGAGLLDLERQLSRVLDVLQDFVHRHVTSLEHVALPPGDLGLDLSMSEQAGRVRVQAPSRGRLIPCEHIGSAGDAGLDVVVNEPQLARVKLFPCRQKYRTSDVSLKV
jgi:hypothetical protein